MEMKGLEVRDNIKDGNLRIGVKMEDGTVIFLCEFLDCLVLGK